MVDQTKNLLIGLFVIAALAIFIYMLLFLHPTVGDEGQSIRVRFVNIDKVSIGTRVLFAGHPVGEVVNIEEVENARQEGMTHEGEVYIYQLTLRIDSGVIIYTSDKIAASTSGLLGERSILITPLPAKKGEKLHRVTDQVLYAASPASVEDVIKVVGQFAEKALDGLDTLSKNKFWDNLGDISKNIEDITAAIKPEKVENIVTRWSDFSDNLHKGTVGRLFNNDDMYLQMQSIFSKGETLMDDINHYGLLFHTSKGWQRMRARRINIMEKLCTPREFSNFFNDEVDQITTSLARVNQVLQEGEDHCLWKTVCSSTFEEVFAELMRRIKTLEDNINLVNQQLVDEKTCGCP